MKRIYSTNKTYLLLAFLYLLFTCRGGPEIDLHPFSPSENLAYNDGYSDFPHPLDSDEGWGRAKYKWHIIDGIRMTRNNWEYGLAFTGGMNEYIDTCGPRQATIDFGQECEMNRIVVWHHHGRPSSYDLFAWVDSARRWQVFKAVHNLEDHYFTYEDIFLQELDDKGYLGVYPIEDTFATISTSKVKIVYTNCKEVHIWINEVEVYNDNFADRPGCLVYRK